MLNAGCVNSTLCHCVCLQETDRLLGQQYTDPETRNNKVNNNNKHNFYNPLFLSNCVINVREVFVILYGVHVDIKGNQRFFLKVTIFFLENLCSLFKPCFLICMP